MYLSSSTVSIIIRFLLFEVHIDIYWNRCFFWRSVILRSVILCSVPWWFSGRTEFNHRKSWIVSAPTSSSIMPDWTAIFDITESKLVPCLANSPLLWKPCNVFGAFCIRFELYCIRWSVHKQQQNCKKLLGSPLDCAIKKSRAVYIQSLVVSLTTKVGLW